MGYNDFFGSFDAKSFEIMAKEYAKNNNKNIEILQKADLEIDEFLQTYEEFLTILIDFYKENKEQKQVIFEEDFALKTAQLKTIISGFCGLYKEIKNEYFFSPFRCKIDENFDIKNQLKNGLENLLFLSPKYLQICHQKSLIKMSFELAKFLY